MTTNNNIERVISAYDYYEISGEHMYEAKEAASLQISIKSQDALDIFNKIADEYDLDNDSRPTRVGQYLSYNSDDISENQIFYFTHDVLDKVAEKFEEAFGKPETETSPIFELGYPEATNENWGVWVREIYVDGDNNFLRQEEY